MNNKTNIYDIDGDLIRAAGDNHQFTVEEAQEKLKHYIEKIKSLDKEDKDYLLKLSTYNQYADNLANYIIRERALRGDFDKVDKPNTTEVLEDIPETVNIPTVQVIDEEGNTIGEAIEEPVGTTE